MKTLNLILISFAVLFVTAIQSEAQDDAIDFSKFTTGNYYKVYLKNGMEIPGTLAKVDENTIELKIKSKNVRIKKIDILSIEKSYELFLNNTLDDGLKTLVLNDGSELIGHIKSKDSLKIRFETLSGTMVVIDRDQIESINSEVSDYSPGDDPNKTRLFLAPTGKNLKAGTGYFSVNELLFPMIALGVTDFFTLAGGMSIIPGSPDQLFYFNGKAGGLKFKDLDLSAGVLYTNISGSGESGLTILYANGTYGTKDASLTLGAGLTFDGQENSEIYPLMIIGGEVKLSKSVKFISENWIPTEPNSAKLFSFGVRFFGKSLAGDFGLIHIRDGNGESALGEGWPFIPWVGLNYNFDM